MATASCVIVVGWEVVRTTDGWFEFLFSLTWPLACAKLSNIDVISFHWKSHWMRDCQVRPTFASSCKALSRLFVEFLKFYRRLFHYARKHSWSLLCTYLPASVCCQNVYYMCLSLEFG